MGPVMDILKRTEYYKASNRLAFPQLTFSLFRNISSTAFDVKKTFTSNSFLFISFPSAQLYPNYQVTKSHIFNFKLDFFHSKHVEKNLILALRGDPELLCTVQFS